MFNLSNLRRHSMQGVDPPVCHHELYDLDSPTQSGHVTPHTHGSPEPHSGQMHEAGHARTAIPNEPAHSSPHNGSGHSAHTTSIVHHQAPEGPSLLELNQLREEINALKAKASDTAGALEDLHKKHKHQSEELEREFVKNKDLLRGTKELQTELKESAEQCKANEIKLREEREKLAADSEKLKEKEEENNKLKSNASKAAQAQKDLRSEHTRQITALKKESDMKVKRLMDDKIEVETKLKESKRLEKVSKASEIDLRAERDKLVIHNDKVKEENSILSEKLQKASELPKADFTAEIRDLENKLKFKEQSWAEEKEAREKLIKTRNNTVSSLKADKSKLQKKLSELELLLKSSRGTKSTEFTKSILECKAGFMKAMRDLAKSGKSSNNTHNMTSGQLAISSEMIDFFESVQSSIVELQSMAVKIRSVSLKTVSGPYSSLFHEAALSVLDSKNHERVDDLMLSFQQFVITETTLIKAGITEAEGAKTNIGKARTMDRLITATQDSYDRLKKELEQT